MARRLLAAVLAACCCLASSTWAAAPAYWACMGACTSGAAAGGLMGGVMTGGVMAGGVMIYGAAACAYVCGAGSGLAVAVSGGFLCFDDGVQVQLPGGSTVPIEQLSVGNATLAGDLRASGGPAEARVLHARREDGSFAGRRLTFGPEGRSITVTDGHLMFLLGNGSAVAREAKDVAAGDRLLAAAGPALPARSFEVLGSEPVTMKARNIVATSEGTLAAEGLTVSAMCEAPAAAAGERLAFQGLTRDYAAADVVQLWKAGHVASALLI